MNGRRDAAVLFWHAPSDTPCAGANPINIETSRRGATFIARVQGRIDSQSAPELSACLPGADDPHCDVLIAHLSSLTIDGMTTTHTPSLATEHRGPQFASAADYSDFLRQLTQSRDIEIVIRSMIAEGDLVAVHNISTHRYKDGRSMTTPYMSFYRVQDGKIVEASHVVDRLHEQSQLN
jgi:ketosteroid isomerase-like protein